MRLRFWKRREPVELPPPLRPIEPRHGGTGRILNPDEEGPERSGYAPPYPEEIEAE